MSILDRYKRRVEAFQKNYTVTALTVGVIKKYGSDNANNLCSQLTYTLFLTIFPLLLIIITILTLLLASDPSLRQQLLKTTFSEFPLVGSQLSSNIHVLKRDSVEGLIIGIVGLLYGCMGLSSTVIHIMDQVWSIKQNLRLSYLKRLEHGLWFLVVLGIGVAVTSALSGFGTYSKHAIWLSLVFELLALLVNMALYLSTFRILTNKLVKTSHLITGSVFGGIAWTILQAFAGYVVGHYLKNDNVTYGVFGSVLGLMAWLNLGARITIYSAELNSVITHRLWPRNLF